MSNYPPPNNPYGTASNSNAGPYSMHPSSSSVPGGYGARPGAPPMFSVPPGNVPSYAPPGTMGPPGAPPATATYGAPPSYPGMPGAPPAAYYAPPASGYTGPPAGFMPPPSGAMVPVAAAPVSSRPPVQFFSPSGGAAVPALPSSLTPPASSMGPPNVMGGPPMGGMGGPPMGGPPMGGPPMGGPAVLSMPPPPSGYPGPGMAHSPQHAMHQYPASHVGNSMVGMPTGFDPGTSFSAQVTEQPGSVMAGAPLPTLDEIDLSIQCNPSFLRATVTKLVGSQAQATVCRVPLGIVCKPMCGDKGATNDEIEVVDFGSTGIVRCKRCRTYINPYVAWADNGRRWR
jgi:protein transport protein SEC24